MSLSISLRMQVALEGYVTLGASALCSCASAQLGLTAESHLPGHAQQLEHKSIIHEGDLGGLGHTHCCALLRVYKKRHKSILRIQENEKMGKLENNDDVLTDEPSTWRVWRWGWPRVLTKES